MTTQVENINIRIREDGSRVVTRGFLGIGAAGDRASNSLSRLKGVIAGVVTGVVVNQLRQLLDTYTQIQNQLRLTTTSQSNLNAVYNELIAISGRTRSSLEANVELYSKLSIAAKDLGVSQREVLNFTESINKAIKLSGASAQEAEGGLRQLAQGLASGALRGDELNSVMENLPAVADVIAKSMNITRGELRKLGAEGKISGDIILKAFREARGELDERFKKTVPTLTEGFVALKNQLLVTVGALDSATGSSSFFAEALVGVVTWVREITPELVNIARALVGSLDPMDELTSGGKVLATVLISLWGALKAVTSLISGVVLIAFKTAGKVIGGVVAAITAVLRGEFSEAYEIVKEAGSDIRDTYVTASYEAGQGAIDATSEMFTKLNQVWDKGARQIQDRQSEMVGQISDVAGTRRVGTGIDEKELEKQARALAKLASELNGVINQVAPLEGAYMDYVDAINIVNEASDKGIITNEKAAVYLELIEERYYDILNPLEKLNSDMNEQIRLLQMSSREREVEAQVLDITQYFLEQNVKLTRDEVTAIREKLYAIQALNEVTAVQDDLLGASVEKRRQFILQIEAINKLMNTPASGFTSGDGAQATVDIISSLGLDPMNTQAAADANVTALSNMYEQIRALREANLISEQEAAGLSAQAWAQSQQQRLQTANTFLSQLSELQNSKSKTAAKIGKAAAIAQATIKTYESATSAYAAMAGIPYIGPALGIAAAAAAVAAGLANVRAIKSQPVGGYMTGGYTGDGPTRAIAGNVHGQEFVMNAMATRRLGVDNLEALQRGNASIARQGGSSGSGGGSGKGGGLHVEFKNYGTSKTHEVQQLSEDRIRIIARDEATQRINKETPDLVATQLANPQSKISKSMGKNTTAGRRR